MPFYRQILPQNVYNETENTTRHSNHWIKKELWLIYNTLIRHKSEQLHTYETPPLTYHLHIYRHIWTFLPVSSEISCLKLSFFSIVSSTRSLLSPHSYIFPSCATCHHMFFFSFSFTNLFPFWCNFGQIRIPFLGTWPFIAILLRLISLSIQSCFVFTWVNSII